MAVQAPKTWQLAIVFYWYKIRFLFRNSTCVFTKQIDGADLANLQQSEVTSLLKSRAVGETIELVISRGVETEDGSGECNKTASERPKNEQKNEIDPDHSNSNESELLEHQLQEQLDDPNFQCLRLDIKLNDSPSAGLGISLKAQRKFLNGRSTDSGLYIQSVSSFFIDFELMSYQTSIYFLKIFHGSAAYKDGRLKIDDRLVGIENTSILLFNLNSEALGAFLRSLSALPSSATSVWYFLLFFFVP
jgi:hypothetical protein